MNPELVLSVGSVIADRRVDEGALRLKRWSSQTLAVSSQAVLGLPERLNFEAVLHLGCL